MAAQRHACGKDAFHHWATDAAEKKPLGRLFLCLLSLLAPTPPCRPADADRRPRPACPVFVPHRGHDSHHLIAPPSLSRLLASGSPASQIAPVGLAEFFSRIGIPTSDPASTGGSRIRKRQAPPLPSPSQVHATDVGAGVCGACAQWAGQPTGTWAAPPVAVADAILRARSGGGRASSAGRRAVNAFST